MFTKNTVNVMGRLGKAPTLKSEKGPAVRLDVATDRYKSDTTDWHTVTVFGKTAEACMASLKKGSMVDIEGRIKYDKYTQEDGTERWFTEIIANPGGVRFLDPKAASSRRDEPPVDHSDNHGEPAQDDIPF